MTDPVSDKILPFPEHGTAQRRAGERLDSWKEIAAYLDRGTRTVQRWEQEEGLPVHRLRHAQGSTVYAYRAELDAWWENRRSDLEPEPPRRKDSRPSIAVLPFTDMSQEKDQEYFCEGMAEEIISALGKVKGLYVGSRRSASQFKGSEGGSKEIGSRLGVGTLLEGSVRKSGNQLRIAVQLTDVESGYQLWSERYDREMRDVFAIQDEIARNIVQALELTLSAEERGAMQKVPTTNVQAYDYYLRGRKAYYGYGRNDVELAIELFCGAVELDGQFVLAYAGLADCWSYMYLYAERSEENFRKADESSFRAVELDPGSAQAQASRAVALSLGGRAAEAERAFEDAIRLDPSLFEAHYFYARHSFVQGHLEKAAKLYRAAMHVRPEDYQAPLLVAQIYDDLGMKDEAKASRERGVETAERHLRLNPDDARAVYMIANGLAALGDHEKSREWAERALAMRPNEPMLLYNVGCVYSLLGETDLPLTCLEKAVENGLRQRGWFEHDSNLDRLRTHPRFQHLMVRLP